VSQVKIPPEEIAKGEDIDWTDEKEHWNTYKLKDGTTLKVKIALRGVKRLQKHNPDGTPIYMINSYNLVRAVDVPKKLMGKVKPSEFKPV